MNAVQKYQEETRQEQPVLSATIQLKVGTANDFKVENYVTDNAVSKKVLSPKIGQPYWLRSALDKTFMNNCYLIREDMDWIQFKIYLNNGQIYVPVTNSEILDRNESN